MQDYIHVSHSHHSCLTKKLKTAGFSTHSSSIEEYICELIKHINIHKKCIDYNVLSRRVQIQFTTYILNLT